MSHVVRWRWVRFDRSEYSGPLEWQDGKPSRQACTHLVAVSGARWSLEVELANGQRVIFKKRKQHG